jgi:hypothetical protein
MSSNALTAFRPQSGLASHVASLGLIPVYGISRPSFATLAQQLLFRILFDILERIYRFLENAFTSKFDAYMSRRSVEDAEPGSKILKELTEQSSMPKQSTSALHET